MWKLEHAPSSQCICRVSRLVCAGSTGPRSHLGRRGLRPALLMSFIFPSCVTVTKEQVGAEMGTLVLGLRQTTRLPQLSRGTRPLEALTWPAVWLGLLSLWPASGGSFIPESGLPFYSSCQTSLGIAGALLLWPTSLTALRHFNGSIGNKGTFGMAPQILPCLNLVAF